MSKTKFILKFIWNTWKYWWNDTDDEILPEFAQLLWTLKYFFSSSYGKLFLVLFQAIIFSFSLRKCKKDFNIPNIPVQDFCPLKLKLLDFLWDSSYFLDPRRNYCLLVNPWNSEKKRNHRNLLRHIRSFCLM